MARLDNSWGRRSIGKDRRRSPRNSEFARDAPLLPLERGGRYPLVPSRTRLKAGVAVGRPLRGRAPRRICRVPIDPDAQPSNPGPSPGGDGGVSTTAARSPAAAAAAQGRLPGAAAKAEPRNAAGKALFGALFVVVLPLGLVGWTTILDRSLEWPVPRWPAAAVAVIVAGGALMLVSMLQLSVHGRGLPMSAHPPRQLVTQGVYRLHRHPIYLGAALLCFGSSLLSRSSSGLYLLTPMFVVAMTAYVYGYEKPGLEKRFGEAVRAHEPLLSLPRATDAGEPWLRRALLAVAVFAPWPLAGYLIDSARCTGNCSGAFVALFDDPRWLSWSEACWVAPYLLLALRLLASRTGKDLRGAVIAGFTATLAGNYLYGVLPGLGLDLSSGGWELAVTNLTVCAVAFNHRITWVALTNISEKVANSRRDWLVAGGRFRVISHAVYSGTAGATGAALAGMVLGSGFGALALGTSGLIGAAIFARLRWGNPTTLLRPFGFWGGVLGTAIGGFTVHLAFDVPLATVALSCALAAPFTQAIGRLRCLSQGCCHGIETSPRLGIRVWQSQSRVVTLSGLKGRSILPTQLYSILFNLVLGLLLLSMYLSGAVDSTLITGLYFALTGIERFAEDAYRGEKQTRWAGPLRENQWIAIAALVLGMATALVGSTAPAVPDDAFNPGLLLGIGLSGLVAAAAMSMDFPRATMPYSRLSG